LFCFALFLWLIFFCFQFHHSIFVWLRILLLGCLGSPLMRSPRSHDLGHRSKKLAQVKFGFSYKHFFSKIFWFPIYGVIPISCPISYIWFVDLVWLSDSLETFFFLHLSIILAGVHFLHFANVFGLAYFFYGVSLFNQFHLYLSFNSWVF